MSDKANKPKKSPKLDTMKGSSAPKLATITGTSSKETIYVDVDDEITTIIEKVRSAKGKIIALVLPKRATVLQSIVNMKLLKRTANEAGKNLVLVTSEAGLLPLAGLVGMHVADTPSSRPAIPSKPDQPSDEPLAVEEPLQIANGDGEEPEFDPDKAANMPVGELASAAGATALSGEADEELIMGDDGLDDKPDATPVKKNKKLMIPNFDKFRLRLILGVVLLALLVTGWIFAAKVLPSAAISIETDSQTVKSNLTLTLDTGTKAVDTENKILPATAQTANKTLSQQVATTGEKNNGTKATGTVTLQSSDCTLPASTPAAIPAGSSVATNGHTYITQQKASFSNPQLNSNGSCIVYTSNSVDITALKGGSDYNTTSSAQFTGPNGSTGTGSANGGTDSIVKIVAQADIDSAKSKIAAQNTDQVKQELTAALKAKNLLPIDVTFVVGDQKVTTSANVGDAADNVTVTSVVPYTMLGVKRADLQEIVVANVKSQIDTSKQKVLNDGIDTATYTIQDTATATSAIVNAKFESIAGPELNVDSIKKEVVGKKAGDIKSMLSGQPGVTKVDVKMSPFWVTSAPANTEKITVTIAKPSGTN